MSVSYYAKLILGCRVDGRKLFTRSYGPTCEHAFDASFKHCPQCGKPQQDQDVPRFDRNEEEDTDMLAGVPIIFDHWKDEHAYVGFIVAEDGQYPDLPSLYQPKHHELEAAKGLVQHALLTLDLWNEDAFGLNVYLYAV